MHVCKYSWADRFEHRRTTRVCVSVCVHVRLQSCPQMALQCYRKALETDAHCVCALHKSVLAYRETGNTQAEIQALRLLHSVSNWQHGAEQRGQNLVKCICMSKYVVCKKKKFSAIVVVEQP